MLGGTSKGKNYFRNQHRRKKQKALKAEVITLKEKVKELGDQLELEKKKNEKLLTELGKKKSRPTRCPPAEKKKNEKLLAEQLCSKRAPPARRPPPPPPQVQQVSLDLKSRRQDDPTPARSSAGGLLDLCYSCGAKWEGHEDLSPVVRSIRLRRQYGTPPGIR
eukprot:CAMPEP_0206378644 /NCGR_PEP_ID=MMETSP0294-20121207/10860_1 /ASSEMBLY_ACC=CAM_ASM_000327 /TAXON_ID=39354 /ORGANISM="Heterosigma akashiwo, Strain CCMP2393" /LENGTH=162 /DNA_ID=CAMNT_0053827319 /DNA_START=461 /DNA_END=949 /DNA_ORIENTATION=-